MPEDWSNTVVHIDSDSHPWGCGSEVSASVSPPLTQRAGSSFWPQAPSQPTPASHSLFPFRKPAPPVCAILATSPSSPVPPPYPWSRLRHGLAVNAFLELILPWYPCLLGFPDTWESPVVFSSPLFPLDSHCMGKAPIPLH